MLTHVVLGLVDTFSRLYRREVITSYLPGYVVLGDASSPPSMLARGDVSAPSQVLPSPLPGIADDPWTKFVFAMKTKNPGDVSPSNAIGMFEMMPRRLVDLGLVEKPRRVKHPVSGRIVTAANFIAPMTADIFRGDPTVQYKAFCDSMTDYASRLKSGEIRSPKDMSLSTRLAVLHRCGPKGLDVWENPKARFPATVAVVEKAKDIF